MQGKAGLVSTLPALVSCRDHRFDTASDVRDSATAFPTAETTGKECPVSWLAARACNLLGST